MDVLDSAELYNNGKWSFRLDRVRLNNGLEADLPILNHPGSVVLVPILGDQIVMISQFRGAINDTILELPAGTLEWGEDMLLGAQRELREETGYRAETLTLLSKMLPSPSVSNEVMHILLATGLTPDPLPMDEDEEIEVRLMPFANLVADALAGRLVDAKSVVGVLQANAALSQI